MHFQWYPGHMTKAKRAMQEDIKLIDVIVELVDARIPRSSKNPDIDALANGKSRILLLNKSDMADPAQTARWKAYYEKQGFFVLNNYFVLNQILIRIFKFITIMSMKKLMSFMRIRFF